MPATTFLNGTTETSVSIVKPLPAQMIDGYTSATIAALNLNGGATPVAASPMTARAIDVFNNTGTDIQYMRSGVGAYFPIPNGTGRLITAITNAADISFRRIDQSATTVSLSIEVLS